MNPLKLVVPLLALALSSFAAISVPNPARAQSVAVCDPTIISRCMAVAADGSITVSGGGGGGGAVTVADGAAVTLGAIADTSAQTTVNGNLATIRTNTTGLALEAGGNLAASKADLDALVAAAANPAGILGVNGSTIATSANPFPVAHYAITTGGATSYGLQSAASTNSTSVKGSAGTLYGLNLINTTATIYYLRMYDASSAPTCSSATNYTRTWPIPASTSGAGVAAALPSIGVAFASGIAFCLTGGPTSTDNTNAATGVFVNIDYK